MTTPQRRPLVLGVGIEEPPNSSGAFPRLDDNQRAALRGLGAVRAVQPGEVVFREGSQSYDFFDVESGAVAIVEGYGSAKQRSNESETNMAVRTGSAEWHDTATLPMAREP